MIMDCTWLTKNFTLVASFGYITTNFLQYLFLPDIMSNKVYLKLNVSTCLYNYILNKGIYYSYHNTLIPVRWDDEEFIILTNKYLHCYDYWEPKQCRTITHERTLLVCTHFVKTTTVFLSSYVLVPAWYHEQQTKNMVNWFVSTCFHDYILCKSIYTLSQLETY